MTSERVDHRGPRAAVRECPGSVWLTLLWDAPDAADIAAVTKAWERAAALGSPYRSLVDVRRVTRVDPLAFAALARHLRERTDFHGLLERQAVVQPDGVVGAVSAGILKLIDWKTPLAVFGESEPAIEWLAPGDAAIADAYASLCDEVWSTPEVVRALRALLADACVGVDVESAARRLGRSARTFQRELSDAATSFSAELDRARVERAKELLSSTDQKVAAIARGVGYQSDAHFSKRFVALTGMTPAAWRVVRRTP